MKTKSDLAALMAAMVAEGAMFRIDSVKTSGIRPRSSRHLDQRGLGLPDATTISKTTRNPTNFGRPTYLTFRNVRTAGRQTGNRRCRSQTFMRIETELAKGSMPGWIGAIRKNSITI